MTTQQHTGFGILHFVEETEGPGLAKRVLENQNMLPFLRFFDMSLDTLKFIKRLKRIETVSDLQSRILVPIFEEIFETTTDGLSGSGLSRLPRDKGVLYLSNHRDIILDSASMNMLLFKNGLRLGRAGIGDNLVLNDTVNIIFDMMKCFVVKRSLVGKEQVRFLRQMSEFIAYTITERKSSIWLAQKSGRSKDGNDRTNPAVLKMLSMAGRQDPIAHLQSLQIVATACSYEWDPCDVFKTRELLAQAAGTPYVKQKDEDLVSIRMGICDYKGRIHVGFSPIDPPALEPCRDMNDKERYIYIAALVDSQIVESYKLWPSNYVAADLLTGSAEFASQYTEDDKTAFLKRMDERLTTADETTDQAREIFLSGYANPVFNRVRVGAGVDSAGAASSDRVDSVTCLG